MLIINLDTAKKLSGKRFQDFLKTTLGNEHFYIFVYATWCDHCKVMKPKLQAAVRRLKANNAVILMIADDAFTQMQSHHPKIIGSALNRIQGFPTLMRISKAKRSTEYRGDRSTEDILKFIQV